MSELLRACVMKKKRRLKPESSSPASSETRSSSAKTLDAQVIGAVIAIKILVLLFGAQAFVVSQNRRLNSFSESFSIWNRFDAPHYLEIARSGYASAGIQARWIVFFPLYPWLVRVFAVILRNDLASAFFVSTIASIAAAVLLYRLAALDDDKDLARTAVFFMFIFPTSYFLHIGYTESLFLALVLGAFFAARRRQWWAAGLLGLFACMARVNGVLLLPAFGFEAWDEFHGTRRWRWQWLYILVSVAGLLIYLLINRTVHGDAFAFLRMQDVFWSKSIAWPWTGVIETVRSLSWREPSEAQMVAWQEFFFTMLGLALTIWSWLLLRTSYAVWMTLNWLLWTSTRYLLSVPRYTLVMFPIFILFARWSLQRWLWQTIITVWSLLFLGLFVTRFVQGFWAF